MADAHTPMPTERPHIAHVEPAWRGDRPAQMLRIHEGGCGDFNFRWFWHDPTDHNNGGESYNLHYGVPAKDRYPCIVGVGGHVRKMTRRERRRRHWTAGEVDRWRRPIYARRRRGRRTVHMRVGWEQPRTYRYMAAYAAGRGRTICAELKSAEYGIPAVAAAIVRDARQMGHPMWFTHLYKIGGSPVTSAIVAAIEGAGGSCAVIFGRFQFQRRAYAAARKSWPVQPTATW